MCLYILLIFHGSTPKFWKRCCQVEGAVGAQWRATLSRRCTLKDPVLEWQHSSRVVVRLHPLVKVEGTDSMTVMYGNLWVSPTYCRRILDGIGWHWYPCPSVAFLVMNDVPVGQQNFRNLTDRTTSTFRIVHLRGCHFVRRSNLVHIFWFPGFVSSWNPAV